jgi:hypothetical protein
MSYTIILDALKWILLQKIMRAPDLFYNKVTE